MLTFNRPSMKMLRRKPSKWEVEFEGRKAVIEKTSSTDRGIRWRLTPDGGHIAGGFFKSRREALYYFTTGERFKTTPRFAVVVGRRGTKRVR